MIRIAVVDDDEHDASQTKSMIDRYYEGRESAYCVSTFGDGESLLKAYNPQDRQLDDGGQRDGIHERRDSYRNPKAAEGSLAAASSASSRSVFDCIFMDIEMPGISGLETARKLRLIDTDVVLIFTTVMAQYATAGYDVDAIGYLVKPLQYYGLALKMSKAESLMRERRGVTVPIHSAGGVEYIRSADVRYVEVYSHEILYHVGAQRVLKAWGTLRSTAQAFEGEPFVMASRYCLVNLRWVSGCGGGTVSVDGEELQVSRARKKPLMQALAAYYGG